MRQPRSMLSYLRAGSLLLAVSAGPAFALQRSYESNRPVGETVADLVERIGDSGLRFQIRQVYSGKSDGKEGFVLSLAPRGSLCEITFRQDPTNPKRSVIRLFAQDRDAAERLHTFFTNKLKLKELGVNENIDDRNPWPVRIK